MTRLAIASLGALSGAVLASREQHPRPNADTLSAMTPATIPSLILVATLILSLEIFDQKLLSRPLSVLVLIFVWGAFLSETQRLGSLISVSLHYGVQATFAQCFQRRRSVLQPVIAVDKIRTCGLLWMRVFVWGATLATAGLLAQTGTTPGPSLHFAFDAIRTGIFFVLHSECTELVLLLYFLDNHVDFHWRRRTLLWMASFVIGALASSSILANIILRVRQRVYSTSLVVLLIAGTAIVLLVPWRSVGGSIGRAWRAFATAAKALYKRTEKSTPAAPKARRRSSILYRSTSEVEVVEMASHYQPYDLRNKLGDARSPV